MLYEVSANARCRLLLAVDQDNGHSVVLTEEDLADLIRLTFRAGMVRLRNNLTGGLSDPDEINVAVCPSEGIVIERDLDSEAEGIEKVLRSAESRKNGGSSAGA